MQGFDFIFSIAVLIMSVVIHEVSHGYAADYLGDRTARDAGRLTLNPASHLDPFGSILFPLFLAIIKSPFIFGWAKPVPFNPYNLLNQKWGPAIVGLAGPLANVLIALCFGLLIRFGADFGIFPSSFFTASFFIVQINLILAFVNLMPVPPLDGSRILFSILPFRYNYIQYYLEKYGLIFAFIFIIVLWSPILSLVVLFSRLISGL